MVGDVLDPDRLSGLVDIGVDEISWKKPHNYLTLGRLSGEGWERRGDLACVFDELGKGSVKQVESVSMDLGPAWVTFRA